MEITFRGETPEELLEKIANFVDVLYRSKQMEEKLKTLPVPPPAPAPIVKATKIEEPEEFKKVRGRPKIGAPPPPMEVSLNEIQQEANDPLEMEAPSLPVQKITYDDLYSFLKDSVKAKVGVKPLLALFKKFGIANLKELDEKRYHEMKKEAEKLLS